MHILFPDAYISAVLHYQRICYKKEQYNLFSHVTRKIAYMNENFRSRFNFKMILYLINNPNPPKLPEPGHGNPPKRLFFIQSA